MHIPGPWKFVLLDEYPNEAFVQWPNGGCSVSGSRVGRENNARLIAAAPDLLEALLSIYDRHNAETMEKARAAIAKATGKQT